MKARRLVGALAGVSLVAAASQLVLHTAAQAAAPAADTVRITEFMAKSSDSSGYEFVEFTNVGSASVSMSGWSYDDSHAKAGTVSLSGFGTVAAGASVYLIDESLSSKASTDATDFRKYWGLASAVPVIANSNDNLSDGGDAINLYDGSSTLVDTVTFGSVSDGVSYYPGSGAGSVAWSSWTKSKVGDSEGSVKDSKGNVGSVGKAPLEIGSGTTGGGSGGGTSTIAPAYAGLEGSVGDATNPTMPIALSSNLSAATVTGSSASTSIAASVTVSGTGTSRTVTVTPGTKYGTTTITLTSGSATASFKYGLSRKTGDSTSRYLSGTGNLSSAIDVGSGYDLSIDDENDLIRLYNTSVSGEPVKTWDPYSWGVTTATNEIDFESAARVGNDVYLLGSMSNDSDGDFVSNRDTLVKATITGSGASTALTYDGVYYHLEDDVVAWSKANSNALGIDKGSADSGYGGSGTKDGHLTTSLNVEGLEFAPGSTTTAYLGLRGPLQGSGSSAKAVLLPVTNFSSLITSTTPLAQGRATFGTAIQLALGGRGIREIRKNASDQYLISAAKTDSDGNSEGNTFVLCSWDGNAADAPVTQVTLPEEPNSSDVDSDGSWESIYNVPNPLTSGSSVSLLQDDGDVQWYEDGIDSKSGMAPDLMKCLTQNFTLTSTPAT